MSEETRNHPWVAPTCIVQDVDLWIPSAGATPVKTVALTSLPGQGVSMGNAQECDRQGGCNWVTLDGTNGALEAWLAIGGQVRRMAHGVSTWVGGVSKVQVLPMPSDRTSNVRLLWSATPMRLEWPSARVITRVLTAGTGLFSPTSQCFSLAMPGGPGHFQVYMTGSAAGTLTIVDLADDGVNVSTASGFAAPAITGPGTVDVVSVAYTGAETLAFAADVTTQIRVRVGVRT